MSRGFADEVGPNFTVGSSPIGGSGSGALPGTFTTITLLTPKAGAVVDTDPVSKAVSS